MRLVAGFFFVLMVTAFAATAGAAEPPTTDQILTGLGFSDTDKKAINSGEIIAIDLPAVLENQLNGAVAMRVTVSLDRAAAFYDGGQRLTVDPTVKEFGILDSSVDENDWENVRLGADEEGEAKKILAGRPASVLNLSPEEAATLKKDLTPITADQPGAKGAVNTVYRRILAERYRSYRDNGLNGVAPYVRGVNGRASPAAEIRADLTAASFSILERFPAFGRAVLDFPENQPPGVTSTFFWIRTTVEGRPHDALTHEMKTRGPDFLLVYSRDYFSAHTYNTLQSTFLWLPDDKGLLAVHVNAGTTDEITGFFSGIARQVGKDRMKSGLIANFTEVRKQLTR